MPTHKDLPYSKEFADKEDRSQKLIKEFIHSFNRILEKHLDEGFEIRPTANAKIHTNQVVIDMLGAENDPKYMKDHFAYTPVGIQPRHSSARKVLRWYYEKLDDENRIRPLGYGGNWLEHY